MSRGPGSVEREIIRLFADNPSRAFLLEDIAKVVFPAVPVILKKHRVSILRAAYRVMDRLWWAAQWAEYEGKRHRVFFNMLDLQSVTLATFCHALYARRETIWTDAQRSIDAAAAGDLGLSISKARCRAWQAEHDGRQDEADAIWAELEQQRMRLFGH